MEKSLSIDEKESLAGLGDMGKAETCFRFLAARRATGLSQKQFGDAAGQKVQVLSNMEAARQFPNKTVMRYLYRAHRIDFNFILHGDFSHLPQDVQDKIFSELSALQDELDRKEDSD